MCWKGEVNVRVKKCMAVALLLTVFFSSAFAQGDPAKIAWNFLDQAIDLKNVQTFEVNAPEYSADEINFWFDFREGWHTVMVLHDGKMTSTVPMDDLMVLNGLCELLPKFEAIQSQMPNGVEVSFTVAFTDENRLHIALDDYLKSAH